MAAWHVVPSNKVHPRGSHKLPLTTHVPRMSNSYGSHKHTLSPAHCPVLQANEVSRPQTPRTSQDVKQIRSQEWESTAHTCVRGQSSRCALQVYSWMQGGSYKIHSHFSRSPGSRDSNLYHLPGRPGHMARLKPWLTQLGAQDLHTHMHAWKPRSLSSAGT